MRLALKMLSKVCDTVLCDINSGNSNMTHEEIMQTIDVLSKSVNEMLKSVQTEYFDRLSLMNEYRISKREFYRLIKQGLLTEQRLPSSTKKVYAKTEMDNLVAQKLVKPLKNKV